MGRKVMEEKVIFILPDSLEELLFALTVVAQYMLIRMVMGRSTKELVVVCKHEELHPLVKACWVWAKVVTAPTREQLEEADLIHEFDAESTYRVTEAVRKPIGESFAIKLGAHMVRLLPPILVEDVQEDIGLVLVAARNKRDRTDESWRWPYLEDFVDQLKASQVPVEFLPEDVGWEELRRAVGRASVIIGVRGSATLVAAAANRLVIELYPSGKGHPFWFGKQECTTYRVLYGAMENMSPAFVWNSLEKLIKEVKGPNALVGAEVEKT
jgi:hypothetical protein